jgi:uncharacterized protein YfaS (alpha-2-macroglobulin family)
MEPVVRRARGPLALVCVALLPLLAHADPTARVERFSPEGTVRAVRQVTARFSLPIVPLGDPRLPDPFDVSCPEPGQGRWVDPRSWAYEFAQDLPAGVACRFTLRPGLAAHDGTPVSGRREFRFDTGGPAIRVSLPHEGHSAIDERQIFLLATDGAVDAASVGAHASCAVNGIGEAIAVEVLAGEERAAVLAERRRLGWQYFRILWKSGEESLAAVSDERIARAEELLVVLRCRRELPPDAQVSLVWGAGIAGPSGIATTQDQVLAFQTRPAFHAEFSCRRVRPDAACLPLGPLELRFSAPVTREDAARVQLLDASGRAWPAEPDLARTTQRLRFPGPFAESASLRIELPPDLRDDAGRPLANAARFPLEVATDELPPLAKFSGEFGILEAREGGVLPVTLRNLEPEVAARALEPAIPARSLRLADDDAEIIRWLKRVQARMEPSSERVGDHGEWKTTTGARSVFEDMAGAAPDVREFSVPKPEGARAFEVVGIPLAQPGFHVVELASPRLGAALLGEERTRYVATTALVTNLSVHFEWGRASSLVWVTTLDRAEPVAGARVQIADYCSGKPLWEGVTDADGIARVPEGTLSEPHGGAWCSTHSPSPLFVSARAGEELGFTASFWNEGIQPYEFGLPMAQWTGPWLAHAVLDRTLLRAGETLGAKLYVREQTAGGFALPPLTTASLVIAHDASDQEFSQEIALDAGGVAEAVWPVPRDAKLGRYSLRLRASLGGETRTLDAGSFQVEEFRVPTMKAVVQPPAEPLVGGGAADVDLFVGYLSGGGASGAPVKLRTQVRPRSARFPGYTDYAFGGEDVVPGVVQENLFDLEQARQRAAGPAAAPAQVIPVVLDAAGAARVRVPDLPRVTSRHEVVTELEYQDANGEVLTAASRFELWPARVAVGIRSEGWVASAQQMRFRVAVLDAKGKPAAGVPVRVDLFQRTTYSHRRRLVGGFYAYESLVETKAIEPRCKGRTDENGILACEVAPGVSGQVALRARAEDGEGNAAIASTGIWVAGADDWWFGGGASDRIDVLPERAHYQPGETARLQVRMPFRKARALVTVEREGVLDAFVTELSGRKPVVEVPIAGSFAPNVFVSVLAVRGRVGEWGSRLADLARRSGVSSSLDGGAPTALVDLSRPSWRLGIAKLDVGWTERRLEVEVVPDAERFRVRETAGVRIAVRRADGGTLPDGAEVAVAAVDEGLLELLPNDSWSLLDAMMARRGISVFTSTAQMQVVGKRHYGRKAVPQGGGGGRSGARELFDTLLLWRARVPLDRNGEARVEVPLNDTLGSFRIAAVASAGADLFGSGDARIRTHQELMLHSGLPPLVREGDRFAATFTLRNATERAVSVSARASLRAEDGAVAAPAQALAPRTFELAPGEAVPLVWDAVAPADVERLVWEVEAREAGGGVDRLRATQQVHAAVPVRVFQATLVQVAGEQSIPVARPADALPDRGGVEVALRARLGDGLDPVREYMARYPYDCFEQQVSQAVALRDRARFERVMQGLPAFLDPDGLVKYFASDWLHGEDVLTAYVLAIANEAGWSIPEPSLARMKAGLAAFVEGRIVRHSALPTADLAIRKLAAIEALARWGAAQPAWIASVPIDPNLWPTSALLDWLGILARVDGIPERDARRAEAERILRARLDLHGTRLAFSNEHTDALWWLMLSADVNAVRLISTLIDTPAWREELPRIAQGALARRLLGRWNTTTANAWGVLAFERFSGVFEKTPVAGRSRASLAGDVQRLEWRSAAEGGVLDFPWPAAQSQLRLAHAGSGRPWAFVTARAAVPLAEPLGAGFRIRRSVTPVESHAPGKLSRGDVARVSLEIDAQSDMTWVVVDDPIPAGARILGGSLARDSALLRAGARREGDAWPAFEERRFEGFRAYYRLVPKGRFTVEYTVRFDNPGRFELPPTRVEALYAPEMFGELPNAPVVVEASP